MAKGKRFDTDGFVGIVQLKGFAMMPDGRQYMGVAGKVSVLRDEEVVGFKVSGGETANWLCRVEGPSGSINILGCQVKLVHQFDGGLPPDLASANAYYEVP